MTAPDLGPWAGHDILCRQSFSTNWQQYTGGIWQARVPCSCPEYAMTLDHARILDAVGRVEAYLKGAIETIEGEFDAGRAFAEVIADTTVDPDDIRGNEARAAWAAWQQLRAAIDPAWQAS